MRPDAESLEPQVILGQFVETGKGEGDMVQAGRPRIVRRQRPGIDKDDAMMLLIVADEGDVLVLVQNLGSEGRAVLIDHFAPAIGLQHDMGQFGR